MIEVTGEGAPAPRAGNAKEQGGNEWLIAPLPSHNPTLGWTLGLPICRLYHPAGTDAEAPAWMTGVTGFYAENKSWGGGAFHKMNLDADRWRLMAGLFRAELLYDYYGIGGGSGGQSLPLKQMSTGGLAEVLREVANHLYAGVRLMSLNTKIQVARWPDHVPPELIPKDLGISLALLTFAPRVVYDTRDSEFYPTSGNLVDLQVQISSQSLGSDVNFQCYEFSWNHYQGMGADGVLALRVAGKYASGDAPFFMYPAFGQGGDLRGYTPGTYRDRMLLAAQGEYRLRVRKNFGIVVFAGVGGVAPSLDKFDRALPSAGAGLRYVVAEKNNVSFRFDAAWGRNEHQFYVGLGEAF
jgi:outer membrane protein assembly factor BamA